MTINEVKTLEDLKKFYEQEAKKEERNGSRDVQRHLASILSQFELSREEEKYVTGEHLHLFSQTNQAAMKLYLQVKAMASKTPVKRK